MTDSNDGVEREVVDHKIRRAQFFKALREVGKLVEGFELEESTRRQARLFALLALVGFLLLAAAVTTWPSISRFVTSLF